MIKKIAEKPFRQIRGYIMLLVSMSGYVVNHATVPRTIFMSASMMFSIYIVIYQPDNQSLSFIYFVISETLYIGFIMLVLAENGFRKWFMKKWAEKDEGYLVYEGILGFLFFHNALSIGYVASSTAGAFSLTENKSILISVLAIPFLAGFIIKILSAKVVTIDIYYWKDMFLGRKICDFVISGPYRYFSNPMYGIGQIQAYAAALWYGSGYGLLAAFLNQSLIFTFYFLFEKKFIERVYLNKS